MSEIVKFNDVSAKMIELRNKKVIIDSDVAFLYGVETREINQAVKHNPRKFPNERYVFCLTNDEKTEVVKNFDNLKVKDA